MLSYPARTCCTQAYPARFAEARERATQTLKNEAVSRAREGVKKVLFYKGKPLRVMGELVYETEHSDSLLMFLLSGPAPRPA
jgi:hypothetical protein